MRICSVAMFSAKLGKVEHWSFTSIELDSGLTPEANAMFQRISWSTLILLAGLAALPASALAQPAAKLPDGLVLAEPSIPAGITGVMRSLNEALSRDVAPRENVAVWITQVIGLGTFDDKLQDASLDMLGIRKLADDGPRLVYFADWLDAQLKAGRAAPAPDSPPIAQQFLASNQRLWKRDEFPLLAEYLDANSRALDFVVVAADLQKYFAPLLSEEDPPKLMSVSYSVERRMSYLAQCLASRALLRFEEGKPADAYRDLLACHKLARLLANGSPLDVSGAKAHLVDSIAAHAEKGILQSGKLTLESATQLLADLRSLPRFPGPARAADVGERAVLHQELEVFRQEEEARRGFFEAAIEKDARQADQIVKLGFDFDIALQRANQLQDQVVRALNITDPAEQLREFRKLDEAYATWYANVEAQEIKIVESFQQDPQAASRWLGENMAMSLRTNLWQRLFTSQRALTRADMTQLGLALVIFKQQRGSYPQSLEALTPALLPGIPSDPYSGKIYLYQHPAENHVQFISWGPNGQNDAGQDFNDDLIYELR